jgi:hypothetical protein
MPLKGAESEAYLCAYRFRFGQVQGEKGMRGGAGDAFDLPRLPERPQCRNEVFPAGAVKKMTGCQELPVVMTGQRGEVRVSPCPGNLFFRKVNATVEVPLKASHEKRVVQHFKKRGRKGEGQPEIRAVVQKVLKDPDEGDVGFQHRFIQPGLLKVVLMPGISDIREMGMEDQQQIPL